MNKNLKITKSSSIQKMAKEIAGVTLSSKAKKKLELVVKDLLKSVISDARTINSLSSNQKVTAKDINNSLKINLK